MPTLVPPVGAAGPAAGWLPPALALCAGLVFPALLAIAAVLAGNGGAFAYPLDGPYIHLALAEQILHGHYGLNPGEPASPPVVETLPPTPQPPVAPMVESSAVTSEKPKLAPLTGIGRVPVGARIRTELAAALKRR